MVKDMETFFKVGAAALIICFATSPVVAQDDQKSLRLSKDRLQCVIENADNYLALNKDPILVFFDLCPKVEPSTEEFVKFATNSLPSIKLADGTQTVDVTRVAALRKSDIECLVRMNEVAGTDEASFEYDASDVVEISFAECASHALVEVP